MITNTIQKEKRRIENLLKQYNSMLDDLPKGSVFKRKINNGIYFYLRYREGNKVITKYIGKDADDILALLEKRKHVEAMIKSLEEELAIAHKALEGIT